MTIQTPVHGLSRQRAFKGRSRIVVVLAFAGIVVSLMHSLVVPLLPRLPEFLTASAADATWAVTATLLAAAVATPTIGRLGDMYGKRRMLLISLGLLIAGSVVGAVSYSLAPLIVGRTLQGLAAGVIPLGISIMRDELPPNRVPGATAAMSASLGVGGALGLPVAAVIAQALDWHTLFWVAAALGTLSFVLVLALVPESRVRSGGRFDVVGALLMSAALVVLLLVVSKGGVWGWYSAVTISLGAGCLVLWIAWTLWELRIGKPLVDLRANSGRQVLLTNVASLIFAFSMLCMSLSLPQILQLPAETGYGLGQSMLVVGLVMAPSGLVMMAVSPLSARITASAGPKWSLISGAVLVAGGYGVGFFLMGALWQLVLVSVMVGAGIGLAYGAMPSLIMGAVPPEESASANGLNSLMRSVGTSLSAALAGLVFAQMSVDLNGTPVPSREAFLMMMAVGAAGALGALGVAAFLPRRKPIRS
ncbi:MFS transporter [Paenarthrobacter ureafaciens]|uniref:MFS transporter n=1 Tax=Paenarthrobacter TaxID=1742992 RepID=UPI0015C1BC9A|nr:MULTISPECIES: MFS transporter [Paenarthrobacter]NWL29479.1 MFS transporter [Paenarthrobacter ureafaciens]QSZ51856.1 MFS transporter [Paenarthrobacter ureafaciens]WOC61427.1 MFS transporter [Paenarthrobacter sp. AT5]